MSIATSSYVKRASADIASATSDSSLVAAISGQKVRVLGVVAVCGGTATTLVFKSKPSGSSAAISATFSLGVNGVLVLPIAEEGWFETVAGEALTATTGTGSTVAVSVVYAHIPA